MDKLGFFDLQVNGYGGIDFNQNSLTLEQLHKACLQLKNDKVIGILATIITSDIPDMVTRIKKITELRKQDSLIKEIIKGIHIEGPFLSTKPGYSGAHSQKFIFPADEYIMNQLLDAGDGLVKIVTLAPEMDKNKKIIKLLYQKNVTVSAGHCDTGLSDLEEAINAGLSMFTHFGNGCPQELHRHDNILNRALTFKKDLWFCFIADNIHIPNFLLKNYLDFVGVSNSIVVSDAMAGASAPPGRYNLNNLSLEVGLDQIVREPGKVTFSGSAGRLIESCNNLALIEIEDKNIESIIRINPMKSIGMI